MSHKPVDSSSLSSDNQPSNVAPDSKQKKNTDKVSNGGRPRQLKTGTEVKFRKSSLVDGEPVHTSLKKNFRVGRVMGEETYKDWESRGNLWKKMKKLWDKSDKNFEENIIVEFQEGRVQKAKVFTVEGEGKEWDLL